MLRSVSGTFWGLHTWFSGHSSARALLLAGDLVQQDVLTTNEDPGLLVSELLDKIAVLSALPSSAFFLTFGHMRLKESDTLKSAGLEQDALLRMRGRLLVGISRGPRTPQVPGSWHCAVLCNLGGCWPGRDHFFRCLSPRFASARRPPRESNFPWRPPHHAVSREPTMCAPRPQPAPKSGSRPPPSAASQPLNAFSPGQAHSVLKALKGLGLSDTLLQQVQQSLAPPQKPAASKLRHLAHLDEQLKALKSRIQRKGCRRSFSICMLKRTSLRRSSKLFRTLSSWHSSGCLCGCHASWIC